MPLTTPRRHPGLLPLIATTHAGCAQLACRRTRSWGRLSQCRFSSLRTASLWLRLASRRGESLHSHASATLTSRRCTIDSDGLRGSFCCAGSWCRGQRPRRLACAHLRRLPRLPLRRDVARRDRRRLELVRARSGAPSSHLCEPCVSPSPLFSSQRGWAPHQLSRSPAQAAARRPPGEHGRHPDAAAARAPRFRSLSGAF